MERIQLKELSQEFIDDNCSFYIHYDKNRNFIHGYGLNTKEELNMVKKFANDKIKILVRMRD